MVDGKINYIMPNNASGVTVGVYVRKDLSYLTKNDISIDSNDCECSFVEILSKP